MRYIILDADNKVISTRIGPSIVEGEIESELGEVGQILQPDGTFFTPAPPPPQPSEIDLVNQRIAELTEQDTAIYELLIERGLI